MAMGLTDITILIDRSGSMFNIKEEMEEGINTLLDEQKEAVGDALVSIYEFDGGWEGKAEINDLYVDCPIDQVGMVEITPRGNTPLLDSISLVISRTKERLFNLDELPDKVLFVIISDGEENSSIENKASDINNLINERKAANWTFFFLGTNQDAIKEAGKIAIDQNTSLTYSSAGISGACSALSQKFRDVRSSSLDEYTTNADSFTSFDDDERVKANI